jgi:hypothetical protein
LPQVWIVSGTKRTALPGQVALCKPQRSGNPFTGFGFDVTLWLRRTAAATSLPDPKASFEVNYDGIPGVDPDKYEVVLAKLTQQEDAREIGVASAHLTANGSATSAKKFSDTPVPVTLETIGRGHVRLTPQAALDAGQYGIVLRPTAESESHDPQAIVRLAMGQSETGQAAPWTWVWDFGVAH